MKTYYNSLTNQYYTEGDSITIFNNNVLFSGIPTEATLLEWGYQEYIEPQPTQEELLERAKQEKLTEIEVYDNSSNVNGFTINSKEMWLDYKKRQQLKTSIDACQSVGRQNVSKWFDGVEYTFPIATWYQMLTALEVYAADALNVTETHKANVRALDNIQDVENYDYTQGYPQKLVF